MDETEVPATVEELRRALEAADATRRRLEALDELLPTLAGVLDIREVFERVSTIAKKVIPHDALWIPRLSKDKTSIFLYASAGDFSAHPITVPIAEHRRPLLTNAWDHLIHADMQEDPRERALPPGQAGYRARLLVPIRLHGETLGGMDFLSMHVNVYTSDDVLVAHRIADHVALAMSHHRLAEQNRETAALRAREASLEMLDGLLSTLAGVLDIREVFEQVSTITSKVLPHDVLALLLIAENKREVLMHAIAGNTVQTPERVPIDAHHEVLTTSWEYRLYDDIQTVAAVNTKTLTRAGYRSLIRVPIRTHGELVGAIDVASLTAAAYSPPDVLVAKRIADHVALALSHHRLAEEAQRTAEARALAGALEARVKSLTAELSAVTGYRRVIGQSESWKKVLKQATQVAATDTTVLLLGESGTGKEVAARFIHRASARSGGPFVALNCAALPEQLLESELFGFERGAFTGAQQAKPGQIEQASGGVLFLDEVAEMSPSAQAKLLRVLQEREFQRLGSTRTVKANIRVVAATNRNLRAAMEAGTFREDLYYRLHVFEIDLPPLRDRKDDILPLSEAFLEDIAKAFGRPPAGVTREARAALLNYHWPGNVRELRNTLERAAILCEGGLITGEHLPFAPARETAKEPDVKASTPAPPPAADTTDLRVLERTTIERALLDARHNKSQAAKMLGLSRKQLYVRLRQHGLE